MVIDRQVVAAALRQPPKVIGTGALTLSELIAEYNEERVVAAGANCTIPLDDVTRQTLSEGGFDRLDDVLPEGAVVTVRKTANVHTGGTIEDVTDDLHPELGRLAVEAAAAVDVPVAGIDLIIGSVDAPEGIVIEVNEQPGLANHEPRPTAARFVDLLFPETRVA